MRFNNVEIITFNNQNGNSFPVRDTKPIQIFEAGLNLKVEKGMELDEVISRSTIFGDDNEDLSWAVVDHNVVKFMEADFDLSRIKKINIPLVEETD